MLIFIQKVGGVNINIYCEFGKRLALLRQKNNLSQSELAAKLSIPQSTYAGYETGKRKIPLELIEKLSLLLNVSPTFLVTGDDFKIDISDTFPTTIEEQEHIKKYRSLDERGKKTIDAALEREYEFVKPKLIGKQAT